MIEVFQDWNFWLSLITISIAIVALFQTSKQIRISNRHQLFDRRLEKYLLVKELLSLYAQNKSLMVNKEETMETVDFCFVWLTNCELLEEMNEAIKKPLHKKKHKIFLAKCEMLTKAAVEIELLWNNEEGKLMSKFVNQYQELLRALCKHHILKCKLDNEIKEKPISLEMYNKQLRKNAEIVNLLSILDAIEDTYANIINLDAESQLIKSLKL